MRCLWNVVTNNPSALKICHNKLHEGNRKISVENFLVDKTHNRYLPICKTCRHKQQRIWRMNNPDKIKTRDRKYYKKNKEKMIEYGQVYRNRTRRASWRRMIKRGTDFKNCDEFLIYINSLPDICVYCSIPEKLIKKSFFRTTRLTLDRMNNDKGYDKDNIAKACPTCNHLKSNVFTYGEMKEIGQKYIRPKWENFSGCT